MLPTDMPCPTGIILLHNGGLMDQPEILGNYADPFMECGTDSDKIIAVGQGPSYF